MKFKNYKEDEKRLVDINALIEGYADMSWGYPYASSDDFVLLKDVLEYMDSASTVEILSKDEKDRLIEQKDNEIASLKTQIEAEQNITKRISELCSQLYSTIDNILEKRGGKV